MKFEIENQYTKKVQFECELTAEIAKEKYSVQLGFAIKKAHKAGADLRGADLIGAYLRGANLRGANLISANLRGAYLRGAYLIGAYLRGANLRGANLISAYLRGAYLRGAYLISADLTGANLRGAYLTDIKKDFFMRLNLAKQEILGLYEALQKGKVDGSCYKGECCCFCGTIANIRKEKYDGMTNNLTPDSDSATERWFLAIQKGDIPQNNQVSAITAKWMREFMDKEDIKYPEYTICAV